jgi:hypothetical protein
MKEKQYMTIGSKDWGTLERVEVIETIREPGKYTYNCINSSGLEIWFYETPYERSYPRPGHYRLDGKY